MCDKTWGRQSPPTCSVESLLWVSIQKCLMGNKSENLLPVSYSASRKKNYILKLHLDTELSNRMWLLDAHPLSPNDSYCCIKISSFLLTKKSVSVKLNMASIDRVPLLKDWRILFFLFVSSPWQCGLKSPWGNGHHYNNRRRNWEQEDSLLTTMSLITDVTSLVSKGKIRK